MLRSTDFIIIQSACTFLGHPVDTHTLYLVLFILRIYSELQYFGTIWCLFLFSVIPGGIFNLVLAFLRESWGQISFSKS